MKPNANSRLYHRSRSKLEMTAGFGLQTMYSRIVIIVIVADVSNFNSYPILPTPLHSFQKVSGIGTRFSDPR